MANCGGLGKTRQSEPLVNIEPRQLNAKLLKLNRSSRLKILRCILDLDRAEINLEPPYLQGKVFESLRNNNQKDFRAVRLINPSNDCLGKWRGRDPDILYHNFNEPCPGGRLLDRCRRSQKENGCAGNLSELEKGFK